MAIFIQFFRLRKAVQQQLNDYADSNEKSVEAVEMPIQGTGDPGKIPDPPRVNGISLATDFSGAQYYRVSWAEPHDPFNPRQYKMYHKIFATFMVTLIAFLTTMTSSIDSAILDRAASDFKIAEVTESLATGMYLIGFGVGALLSSPLSEMVGRLPVYFFNLIIFACWLVGAALAPNIGGQIVFRFLAGVFGAAPLTVAGGSIADLYSTLQKTFGFPIFAVPGFGGPILGPVVGGYIAFYHRVSWRWTEWTMLCFTGAVLLVLFCFKQETFGPQLLRYKAICFRQVTGNPLYKTEVEASGEASFGKALKRNLLRPWLLVQEPIVISFTFYITIVYIIIFTFFDGYPYIFGSVHNLNIGLSNVCFVGLFAGIVLTMPLVPILYFKTKKQLERDGDDGSGRALNQESRLFFAIVGGPMMPVGLFWMAWTDYRSISIWSPLVASAAIGFGTICIFMSIYMYIIDSYLAYAASALTFVALIRYVVAGGMTVVGVPMYQNLGVHWAITVLACISAIATPIPYFLSYFGPSLRRRSKWAVAYGPPAPAAQGSDSEQTV